MDITVYTIMEALQLAVEDHPGPASDREKWDMFRGDNHPRALDGHVLRRLGFKAKQFRVPVTDLDGSVEYIRAPSMAGLDSREYNMTAEALQLLVDIGEANDQGVPWNDILETMKEIHYGVQ